MAKKSRADAMAFVEEKIVPVSEAEPHVKMLLYGRHGSGKTRFAGSSPKALIIDVNEKGTQSIRRTDAEVYQVTQWEELSWVYWYLKKGDHDYETAVIDTLTGMQHLCMRHVLGEAEDRDPYREPNMPDRRAWGKLSELMKPLLLNFRNLPMHVIFICQERVIGEEDMASQHVPDLSPGSRGTACSAVGIIGRMFQKEVRVGKKGKKEKKEWRTCMMVGPHEEFETKDRTGELPRIIVNPSMSRVIKAWNDSPPDMEDEE